MKLLDLNILHNTCNASKAAVTKGYRAITKDGRSCWYKDNGKSVLAVAHIDHVCQEKHFAHVKLGEELLVYSPRLDDRLGVYTIQHVLPLIGCECDILLCDDEEKGASTSSLFIPDKKYNWMVEFDRAGDDAVLYQYEDEDWEYSLEKSGFRIGSGSYSDISYLGHLGVCGVNIGVGYQDYHGPKSHFAVSEWKRNLAAFQRFHKQHEHHIFPHVPRAQASKGWGAGWGDDWWPKERVSDTHEEFLCPYCDSATLRDSICYPDFFVCTNCGEQIHENDVLENDHLYEEKNELPF